MSRSKIKKKFIKFRNNISKSLIFNNEDKNILMNHPAIYYLFEKGEVVYIGESENNALQRILAHNNDKIFDNFTITEFHGTTQERKELESFLIKHYTPKYNKLYNKYKEYEEDEIISFINYLKNISKLENIEKQILDYEERSKTIKSINHIINNYKNYTEKELKMYMNAFSFS